MNRVISIIIILILAAMGSVQAGALSIQMGCPGCKPTMQMDSCGEGALKSHNAATRQFHTPHHGQATDCDTLLCLVPSQQAAGLIDRAQDQTDRGVASTLHYLLDSAPLQSQTIKKLISVKTGPPVPLYTQLCVLRY